MQLALVTPTDVIKEPITDPLQERRAKLLGRIPFLRQLIRRKVANPADAKDLLQIICTKFLEIPMSEAIDNVEAYLYRMAINEAKMFYRQVHRCPIDFNSDLLDEAIGQADQTTAASARQAMIHLEQIHKILDRIPPEREKYRQAVEMVFLTKMPKHTIAKKLGTTGKSVDTYVARGLSYCKPDQKQPNKTQP